MHRRKLILSEKNRSNDHSINILDTDTKRNISRIPVKIGRGLVLCITFLSYHWTGRFREDYN